MDFIQLVPQKDAIYEKDISKLKQKHSIDQYLISHNSFIEIKNDEVSSNKNNLTFYKVYAN